MPARRRATRARRCPRTPARRRRRCRTPERRRRRRLHARGPAAAAVRAGARRRWLYTWGLGLLVAAGALVPALGLERHFVVLLALYGSHHIVRQHLGLLRVYERLNEPPSRLDHVLGRLALELGLYACVLHD